MKAFEIKTYGDPGGLSLVDRPNLSPAAGQVLVRIRAVSLNYRDLVVVRGEYDRKPQIGRIPCSDGAGEVVAVGAGVSQFKPGDRVAGCFFQAWMGGRFKAEYHRSALGGAIDGVLAEEVVFDQEGLIHLPELYSFEEGATLPCAALTAWQSLFVRGRLTAGESVLLLGTGGVSIFALQFARWMGMRVLGVSSSDEKLERARALGLHAGLNYRQTPEWDRWVLDQTGGEGVDLVVEVGGAGTLPLSLRAVRMGGTIAQIGVLSSPGEQLPFPVILHKQVRIRGMYVGSRRDFEEMNACVAFANLRPVVASSSWMNVQEVFRKMEAGSHFGKLAVTVD